MINTMAPINEGINQLCQEAYEMANSKGFHALEEFIGDLECDNYPIDLLAKLEDAVDQAQLARIMSEVGEAVEALRHGNPPSEKIKGHTHVEEELADTLIRIFDYCGSKGYKLGDAVMKKMAYNVSRPYLHGKKS